jgi:hypothetical protein
VARARRWVDPSLFRAALEVVAAAHPPPPPPPGAAPAPAPALRLLAPRGGGALGPLLLVEVLSLLLQLWRSACELERRHGTKESLELMLKKVHKLSSSFFLFLFF